MRVLDPTARTRLRRRPERGRHDLETIQAILDEAFICHVGFSLNDAADMASMCGRA